MLPPIRRSDRPSGQIVVMFAIVLAVVVLSVGLVIDEIRRFDPGFDIVVVDDGSTDRTVAVASDRGGITKPW